MTTFGIIPERMYDVEWIKLLRRTLDANELASVKIVATDLQPGQGDIWQLAGILKDDAELATALDVPGGHPHQADAFRIFVHGFVGDRGTRHA